MQNILTLNNFLSTYVIQLTVAIRKQNFKQRYKRQKICRDRANTAATDLLMPSNFGHTNSLYTNFGVCQFQNYASLLLNLNLSNSAKTKLIITATTLAKTMPENSTAPRRKTTWLKPVTKTTEVMTKFLLLL